MIGSFLESGPRSTTAHKTVSWDGCNSPNIQESVPTLTTGLVQNESPPTFHVVQFYQFLPHLHIFANRFVTVTMLIQKEIYQTMLVAKIRIQLFTILDLFTCIQPVNRCSFLFVVFVLSVAYVHACILWYFRRHAMEKHHWIFNVRLQIPLYVPKMVVWKSKFCRAIWKG